MDSWGGIVVRCAVYATLALAFGVPLQLLASDRHHRANHDATNRAGRRYRWRLALLAVAALASSALGLLMLTAAMTGTAMLPIDRDTLAMVLTGTDVGMAFVVRFLALTTALAAALWPVDRGGLRLTIVVAATGVALATVAWAGHGAMDAGRAGLLHLAADIVHLLASGAWIGAIAVLLAMFRPGPRTAADIVQAQASLSRFATIGSILVGAIIVSGAINGWMIVGASDLPTLPATLYGKLLLAKLALFATMLIVAAVNRWSLTPRLKTAIDTADTASAIAALRMSLAIEASIAFAILAILSYLGVLSPPG